MSWFPFTRNIFAFHFLLLHWQLRPGTHIEAERAFEIRGAWSARVTSTLRAIISHSWSANRDNETFKSRRVIHRNRFFAHKARCSMTQEPRISLKIPIRLALGGKKSHVKFSTFRMFRLIHSVSRVNTRRMTQAARRELTQICNICGHCCGTSKLRNMKIKQSNQNNTTATC